MLWDGPEEEFCDFLEYLNSNPINMQFPSEFGGNVLFFFNVTISIEDNCIKTCSYGKKTATSSLLHFDSCPPQHVKKAVPFGQFINFRRINSDYGVFLSQAQELMDRL